MRVWVWAIAMILVLGVSSKDADARGRGGRPKARPAQPREVTIAHEVAERPLNARDPVFFARSEAFPVMAPGPGSEGFPELVTLQGHWLPKPLLALMSDEAKGENPRCVIRLDRQTGPAPGKLKQVVPAKGLSDSAFQVSESQPGRIRLLIKSQPNDGLPIREITCTDQVAEKQGKRFSIASLQKVLKSSATIYPVDPVMIELLARWERARTSAPIAQAPIVCPDQEVITQGAAPTESASEDEPDFMTFGYPELTDGEKGPPPLTQRQIQLIKEQAARIKELRKRVRERYNDADVQALKARKSGVCEKAYNCARTTEDWSDTCWGDCDQLQWEMSKLTGQDEVDAAYDSAYDLGGFGNWRGVDEILFGDDDGWDYYPTTYWDSDGTQLFGGVYIYVPETGETLGPYGGSFGGHRKKKKKTPKPTVSPTPSPRH